MKYKIDFKYHYGIDYVYCNEYKSNDCFMNRLSLMIGYYVLLKKPI